MKKFFVFLCSMVLILSLSGIAGANLYLQPNPPDLFDLDHHYYYTWGFTDASINDSSLYEIAGINLTFHDIYNWSNESSKLFVWLLDDPAAGVVRYNDGGGDDAEIYDDFLDTENRHDPISGIYLETYETPDSNGDVSDDIPYGYSNRTDITYTFTQEEVDTFVMYLANSNYIGLGFDPDCHFYNSGITLELVPEPATMLLFGTGLIGLAGLGRKKFFKK